MQHEPVVLEATGEEVEKVHLFSIVDEDGEVSEYYIPKKVSYNVSLQALNISAAQGETAAVVYGLQHLLGEEGYQALLEFDELTEEQFNDIARIASSILFGGKKKKGKAAGR